MRLLDSIARCYAPLVLPSGNNPAQAQLAGPSRFAAQIVACPLRFVLGDDLSEASADLAYADGARLVGCEGQGRERKEEEGGAYGHGREGIWRGICPIGG